MKKIIIVLIVLLFVFWFIRINELQEKNIETKRYYIDDEIIYNEWVIKPKELGFKSVNELYDKSSINISNTDKQYVYIVLEVKNNGDEFDRMSFEELFSCGFRIGTWYNSIEPYSFYDVNNDNINMCIEQGKCEIIIFTEIEELLANKNIVFVLDTFPCVIEIHSKKY